MSDYISQDPMDWFDWEAWDSDSFGGLQPALGNASREGPPGLEGVDFENSLASTHSNTTTIARTPSTSRPFKCHFSGCFRAYTHKGDLSRHFRSHATTSTAVCTFDDCPRSHAGRGFPRQDKLVDHLVQGHKMRRNLAKFAATARGEWRQALKNMPDDFPFRSFQERKAYSDRYHSELQFYYYRYDLGSLQQDLTDWEVHQGLIDS